MKYGICYVSETGNTRMLAETIRETAPDECVYFGKPDLNAVGEAEMIFVGFWTNRGSCSKEMQMFLRKLKNRRIALFGTAGFGKVKQYFDTIIENVRGFIDKSNTVVGYFMCQGKMSYEVLDRYNAALAYDPDDQEILALKENFQAAKTHPDVNDLEGCKKFTQMVLKKSKDEI